MMKTMVLLLAAFALPAQVTPPSPAELVERANAATKTQSELGWRYTYREDHTQIQLDKDGKPGKPETKTYDHIMLEGSEYKKLVLIDGKPLDPETQKKVEEDMEKARAERRKDGRLDRTVSFGPPEFLVRLFVNKVTGEEMIDGHKTWRMESEPRSGYKRATKQEEEAMASRRINWFSQEDGYPIRERSEFIRPANGFQPGSILEFRMVKVGEAWLMGDGLMNAELKFTRRLHGRVDSRQHYYDYKRFTSDSTFTPE